MFRFPDSIIRLFENSIIPSHSIIDSRKGFTLLELLVVVGMIAVLVGAIGSSVNQARRRAMITKATQDVKEMTNAILAFENIAVGRSLENYASGGWQTATESSMRMILGGETTESGEKAPILYNAQIVNGAIRDPWGQPYEVFIKKVNEGGRTDDNQDFVTAPILPNFYRLTDEERQ